MTIHEPAERRRTANRSLDFHPGAVVFKALAAVGRTLRSRLEP